MSSTSNSLNRIPIWLVDHDVGGGLPSERAYSHSAWGTPIGHIVLPVDMRYKLYADYVSVDQLIGNSLPLHHVASLSTRRMVEFAVGGAFGWRWEKNEGWTKGEELM